VGRIVSPDEKLRWLVGFACALSFIAGMLVMTILYDRHERRQRIPTLTTAE
jgi:hypothetical protein